MSQTMIMILVVGAIIGAIIFRCKTEILAPLCDAWPEGSSLVEAEEDTPVIASNRNTVTTRKLVSTPTTKSTPVTKVAVKGATKTVSPSRSTGDTIVGKTITGKKDIRGNPTLGQAGRGVGRTVTGGWDRGNAVSRGASRYTSLFTTERVFI